MFNRPLEGEIEAHRRGLGPLALGLHRLFKAGQIDPQPVLFGDLLGEFNREAEGVIELKGLLTGNLFGLCSQHLGQELFAPLQGFQEAGLFAFQLGADHGAALLQLGIGTGHQGDGGLPHQLEEGPIDAEAAAVAHHPAQQAPQDVAAAQVGGGDAIGDQLGDGAAVVADHLQGGLALAIEGVILHSRQPGRRFDQGIDQVGFVVVGHRLENLGHALQPHARINVAIGQGREGATGVAVVLHEHQVVELDEATVVLQINGLIAEFGLEVVVDLRAGTAGSRGA